MCDRAKSGSHDIDIAGKSNAEEMARKQKTLNEVGVIFLSTLAERFSENV